MNTDSESSLTKKCSSISKSLASSKWTLGDVIDLEVLCHEDKELSQEQLWQRDQAMLNAIDAQDKLSRDRKIFEWVRLRRIARFGSDENSPGGDLDSMKKWGNLILAAMGFVTASGAFIAYFPGDLWHPENSKLLFNVHYFWLFCIGLPALLSILGICMLLIGGGQAASWRNRLRPPTFLRGVVLDVLTPFIRYAAGKFNEQLTVEQRLEPKIVIRTLNSRVRHHSSALSLEMLKLIQSFGLGFTLCILFMVTVFLSGSSIQLAWQGTGRIQAEQMHAAVKMLSLPWDWLSPGKIGCLSLEQIKSTQFVQGMDVKAMPALHEWSDFLIVSAFLYGVLPRTLLWWLTSWRLKSKLRNESLTKDSRLDRLSERLTPRGGFPRSPPVRPEPQNVPHVPNTPRIPPSLPSAQSVVLIPKGLQIDQDAFLSWWRKQPGLEAEQDPLILHSLSMIPEELTERLTEIEYLKPQIILMIEGSWKPPLEQHREFLRRLRQILGSNSTLRIGLIGRKNDELLGGSAKAGDLRVWKTHAAILGDTGLDVFAFVPTPNLVPPA